jgi:hypothetical protein
MSPVTEMQVPDGKSYLKLTAMQKEMKNPDYSNAGDNTARRAATDLSVRASSSICLRLNADYKN